MISMFLKKSSGKKSKNDLEINRNEKLIPSLWNTASSSAKKVAPVEK